MFDLLMKPEKLFEELEKKFSHPQPELTNPATKALAIFPPPITFI